MNKNTFKSIGAVFASFVVVVVLSIGTDVILEKTGLMKIPFHHNPLWVMLLVTTYRNVYGVLGGYITATLAPNRPMRHAMIGGLIGFVISLVGTIVMWHEPPHWYPISLTILALPCAWLGGRLRELAIQKNKPQTA